MFCPNCGKDNSSELKYCASCGTNLEAVAQALTGTELNFFTKMDGSIDQLLARYSEHVFRLAPQTAAERSVKGSWKILGQTILTSLVNLILFFLLWNLLPLRFVILLISTPFRLLTERAEARREPAPQLHQRNSSPDAYKRPEPSTLPPAGITFADIPSVTENTTRNLDPAERLKRDRK